MDTDFLIICLVFMNYSVVSGDDVSSFFENVGKDARNFFSGIEEKISTTFTSTYTKVSKSVSGLFFEATDTRHVKPSRLIKEKNKYDVNDVAAKLTIQNLPHVINLGQSMKLLVLLEIYRDMISPLTVHIEIFKFIPIVGKLKIPCLGSVGSCTFKDLCDDFEDPNSFFRENVCKKLSDFHCKCPVKKGTYTTRNMEIKLGNGNNDPENPLYSGDYEVGIVVRSQIELLLQYNVTFNIK